MVTQQSSFNIDDHIAVLKKKLELWAAATTQDIKDQVERVAPFGINQETVDTLCRMHVLQVMRRNILVPFSVDYQTEWSILLIIGNVRKLVQLSLEKQNEKYN